MQLAGADRYNPERLTDLERYVKEQVAKGTYSLEANLALLRLYNFAPERSNLEVLGTLMIKALMRLPEQDFAQCLFLIPERVQEEYPLNVLRALFQHLDAARFPQFWEAVEACRDLLGTVPGFYDAARSYIISSVANTCQKVTKATLRDSLRMEGTTLDELVSEKCRTAGWSTEKVGNATVIILPKNDHNDIKPQVSQGGFKLAQLVPLVAH